jgi:hypothetical protein
MFESLGVPDRGCLAEFGRSGVLADALPKGRWGRALVRDQADIPSTVSTAGGACPSGARRDAHRFRRDPVGLAAFDRDTELSAVDAVRDGGHLKVVIMGVRRP